jgi:hypothetical protein
MRKWGAVVTAFYALIIVALVIPAAVLMVGTKNLGAGPLKAILDTYKEWLVWVPACILIAGQALLLFLSVDTSWRKLKPRAHIAVSCLVTGTLSTFLSGAAVFSLGVGIYGDHFGGHFFDDGFNLLMCWIALWVVWLVVFYLYFRNSSALLTRATSWLLKGSVLELLIAVPSHIIVRRRDDCSAPVVTSFGIATGISIMLLCFGPSVLLLYKKRLNEYAGRKAAAG